MSKLKRLQKKVGLEGPRIMGDGQHTDPQSIVYSKMNYP